MTCQSLIVLLGMLAQLLLTALPATASSYAEPDVCGVTAAVVEMQESDRLVDLDSRSGPDLAALRVRVGAPTLRVSPVRTLEFLSVGLRHAPASLRVDTAPHFLADARRCAFLRHSALLI